MIVLIVVIGVNVFMRYVLGSPMPWAEEVTRYTMVYMTYLAAPLALREGRHIRITLLTERLRGRAAASRDMLLSGRGVLASRRRYPGLLRLGPGADGGVSDARRPCASLCRFRISASCLGTRFLLESVGLFAVNALPALARPVPESVTSGSAAPEFEGG